VNFLAASAALLSAVPDWSSARSPGCVSLSVSSRRAHLKLVVATSVQVAAPSRSASPLALWHLLSLDAPTVAALWVWFLARSQHIHLPLSAPLAMALAVWMLYAADRLLDARSIGSVRASGAGEFEARHFFHLRHRRPFLIGIAASAFALATLLPRIDPAAIHLYLIEGALLVAWFVILHATHSAHRLPKEIAVGLFFSAAVFIPTVARDPYLRASLLPAAILFAALCSLNCLFIYAWEHESTAARARTPHITTRIALAYLPVLAVVVGLISIAVAFLTLPSRLIACACALSLAILLILHRQRHRLSRSHLRAAADLALLTPLLLIPFL
jgi:hypothetical protein